MSFQELDKIAKIDFGESKYNNAKKWLLIGCEIGQRGSDLLNITSDNIRYEANDMFVDIIQDKSRKLVTIPITTDYVKEMIRSRLPHKISEQKLNEYIKVVCEKADITYSTDGKKFKRETRRVLLGSYPKNELITTHSFRRSFATNYYKQIPTPVLMNITGHTRESIFLKYINRQQDKDDNAKLFIKFVKEMKAKNSEISLKK